MSDISIGIIGGTRGMGRWFAQFLAGQGYTVHVTGRSMGMALPELADICRVICVSVPIHITCAVIGKVGPYLKQDALLMDLTSLKGEPVKAMVRSSISEVIGCHPLFGPQVESIDGQHVVICPARSVRWLPWLRDVFAKCGASVVETTPEKHDIMMSIVQGLNHLNTVAMGLVMADLGMSMSELESFTTPLFEAKGRIIKKIFCDNPALYADLIALNPNMIGVTEKYERIIAALRGIVEEGDTGTLSKMMEKAASRFFSADGKPGDV